MSRFSKYLVGAGLFVAGAASVSVTHALGPRPANSPPGAGALPAALPAVAGDPLIEYAGALRSSAATPEPGASNGAGAGVAEDLMVLPAYQPRIELTGTALAAVDLRDGSFAAPVFDFAAFTRGRAGAGEEAEEPTIALAFGGSAGSPAAAAEALGPEPTAHAAGPGEHAVDGFIGSGPGIRGVMVASGSIGGAPLSGRLPSPVPLPAAAFSGALLLGAATIGRRLRRI